MLATITENEATLKSRSCDFQSGFSLKTGGASYSGCIYNVVTVKVEMIWEPD